MGELEKLSGMDLRKATAAVLGWKFGDEAERLCCHECATPEGYCRRFWAIPKYESNGATLPEQEAYIVGRGFVVWYGFDGERHFARAMEKARYGEVGYDGLQTFDPESTIAAAAKMTVLIGTLRVKETAKNDL